MNGYGWRPGDDEDGLDILRLLLTIAIGALLFFALRAYGLMP